MTWRRSIGWLVGKIRGVLKRRRPNGEGGPGAFFSQSGVAPAGRASRRTPNGALILSEPVWAGVGIVRAMSLANRAITATSRMRALTEACRGLDGTLSGQGWSRLVKVNQGWLRFLGAKGVGPLGNWLA